MRLFRRSFKRAEIPVEYSKGFNPQPRFSIASPLSLGIESEEEYMDIELERQIPIESFITRMNKVLPEDVQILDGSYPKDNMAIAAIIDWAQYEIRLPIINDINLDSISSKLEDWLNKGEILISRMRKKGRKRVMGQENIRPLIKKMEVVGSDGGQIVIEIISKTGEKGNLRPLDLLEVFIKDNDLEEHKDLVALKRKGLFVEKMGELQRPI